MNIDHEDASIIAGATLAARQLGCLLAEGFLYPDGTLSADADGIRIPLMHWENACDYQEEYHYEGTLSWKDFLECDIIEWQRDMRRLNRDWREAEERREQVERDERKERLALQAVLAERERDLAAYGRIKAELDADALHGSAHDRPSQGSKP